MRSRAAAALLAALVAGVGCGDGGGGGAADRERTAPSAERDGGPRTWAVLVNGGGERRLNYRSHLVHLRELAGLLRSWGIPDERIFIFSSDGADPTPDLAVRDPLPERFWMLEDLPLGRVLQAAVRYENSRVEGLTIRPATKQALTSWTQDDAQEIGPGDTVLLYVTDHGERNESDPENNSILLWGESLSVDELRGMLEGIPRSIRVVSLMSQCYSGSFVNAMYGADGSEPTGNVCGYYSSSADRPAYGCYAETRARDDVGHSFRFFEALRVHGNLAEAHERVLWTDDTPDVPQRSSDQYLERLLRRAAVAQARPLDDLVDLLLEEARRGPDPDDTAFEPVDRLGRVFGSSSPRSMRELERDASELRRLRRQLSRVSERWQAALDDLKRETLQRFLAGDSDWRRLTDLEAVRRLDPASRIGLARELLEALSAATPRETDERLGSLRAMAKAAQEAAWRMEVREAALLRKRALLIRIAGRHYLQRESTLERVATPAQREAYASLKSCEALELGGAADVERAAGTPRPVFPPLAAEARTLDVVLPGWLGIRYEPLARHGGRQRAGAVRVTEVSGGSPAERAGIRSGDVLLGPPGAHFVEPNQIREWVMSSLVGELRALELLRGGAPMQVQVRIGATPL